MFQSDKPILPTIALDLWEIDMASLIKVKILGRGHFGEVYQAVYGGMDVAVKEMIAGLKLSITK